MAKPIKTNSLNFSNFSFIFQMMFETDECRMVSELICYIDMFLS